MKPPHYRAILDASWCSKLVKTFFVAATAATLRSKGRWIPRPNFHADRVVRRAVDLKEAWRAVLEELQYVFGQPIRNLV